MRRELALFIGGPGARNLLGSVVWGDQRLLTGHQVIAWNHIKEVGWYQSH